MQKKEGGRKKDVKENPQKRKFLKRTLQALCHNFFSHRR